MRSIVSRRVALATGCAVTALALGTPAVAQEEPTQPAATPTGAETPDTDADATSDASEDTGIIVTGSRLRQDPNNSALPLQIITTRDLSREGINSPEQLISFLSTNGNGADNLAANSDVTS
jgi:iron complex outermembrane recepter protein